MYTIQELIIKNHSANGSCHESYRTCAIEKYCYQIYHWLVLDTCKKQWKNYTGEIVPYLTDKRIIVKSIDY